MISAALAIFLATPGAPAAADAPSAAPVVRELDRRSPDFVKCQNRVAMGSFGAKMVKICRTNKEWRDIAFQQSRDADDLITRSAL